jgi:hypothetical protein
LPAFGCEATYLVEVNRLHASIRYRVSLPARRLAKLELELLVGGLTNAEPRLARFTGDDTLDTEGVSQVRVMALVEGSKKAEAGLHRRNLAVPLYLHHTTVGAA